MTISDRNIPSVSCTPGDVSVRINGLQISPFPKIGAVSFSTSEALSSVMQQLGPALAQVKMAGDLVSAVTAIIDFANAVPNSVKEGDPKLLTDSIKALAEIGQKIAAYIPPASYIATVYDALSLIKNALGAISTSLEQLSDMADEADAALQEAQSSGNASLESVANQLQTNVQSHLDCVGTSLLAVLAPFTIISELASVIPSPPELPEIPDLTGKTLDEVIEIVDTLYEVLDAVT